MKSFSHVRLFATLWTVAHQAPPSVGFSRQEYESGLPCPPPGDLPDPEIECASLMSLGVRRQVLCHQHHLGSPENHLGERKSKWRMSTVMRLPAATAKSLQLCLTLLRPHGLQPARLLCPWDSPGRNAGVGCHALLQEIFPTQGSNLHLLSPELAGGFFTTSATCCYPLTFI